MIQHIKQQSAVLNTDQPQLTFYPLPSNSIVMYMIVTLYMALRVSITRDDVIVTDGR